VVVVGQLQHRGKIGWNKGRRFLETTLGTFSTEPAVKPEGFGRYNNLLRFIIDPESERNIRIAKEV
jgi:hypothetical protein